MIGVDEALATILAAATPLPPVEVALLEALGLTLAEAVVAPHDAPPYRNSAMDGYAVRGADLAGAGRAAPVRLAVVAEIAAGHPSDATIGPGQAARIMTGAAMPAGADTVVRFEETDEVSAECRVPSAELDVAHAGRGVRKSVLVLASVRTGSNVRQAGEDMRAGEVALAAGTPLRAAEIGLLASLGRASVSVHRRPRVAILSTGDEVVPIDAPLAPGQLRDSNSYTLASLVRRYGGEPVLLGIARDRLDEVRRALDAGRECDLVVSSAGVSAGDYDVVKDALQAEGRIDLWQVNMKPGRPLAFGRLGGAPYLGLPGNPVAAMVSFEIFGRPLLLRLLGRRSVDKPRLRATALERLENGSARRHFVRVRVEPGPDGGFVCRLAGDQGAGVLTSMALANGLAVVAEGVTAIEPGEPVEVLMLDWD
jgi:molybdopterin molybdotransferase